MKLSRRMLALKTSEQLRSTTAIVTSVSPFTIDLGDHVSIPNPRRAAGYTPVLNDVVLVLRPDDDLIVLDKIV